MRAAAGQRPETFRTQARLLASVRRNGAKATALDSGNSFEYRTGFGWTPWVPVDGLEGQPVVAAENRGISSFSSHNRLVPAGGAAGDLAYVDPYGDTKVHPRDVGGGVTLPVDITGIGVHSFTGYYLSPGVLGPNGFIRMSVSARVITNASRTITMIGGSLSLDSPSMSSSASTYVLYFDWLLTNQNDVTVQAERASLVTSRWNTATNTATWLDHNVQAKVTSPGTDTDRDEYLVNGVAVTSGAITGTGLVDMVFVEYGYRP